MTGWRNTDHMSRKERIWYLMKRQQGRCYYCALSLHRGWHLDHMIPKSLGGSHGIENRCLSCPSCNVRKHTRSDLQFLAQSSQ
jgi:5-methylcytosine-specific restriction endonuclease McrA